MLAITTIGLDIAKLVFRFMGSMCRAASLSADS